MTVQQKTSLRQNRSAALLIITGAMLFSLLFWQEQLALNMLLFEGFIITTLFYIYPIRVLPAPVKWLLPAHLLSLCMVMLYNTAISKIAAGVSLLLLVAFTEYGHRSAWFAGIAIAFNFLSFTGNFADLLKGRRNRKKSRIPVGRYVRFAVFPALLSFSFFLVYRIANNVFAGITEKLAEKAALWMSHFLDFFSFERFLFSLLGFYITGSLLLRTRTNRLEAGEARCRDELQRVRRNRMLTAKSPRFDIALGIMGKLARGILALKNEYTVGLISLVMLNLLLLAINIIDIHYLWFHFTYTPDTNLTKLIHDGTEMLILSIVLAMMVLLFFFRGNLNFYSKNKWLKAGAYAWLIQNTILVISVAIRDYYYIKLMGLAYKRIGVIAFLMLVLAGLVTVFIKIHFKKTNYYLLRVNAWAAVSVLILAAMVNWDVLIAGYNIRYSKKIPLDLPFLLSLSDRTLPVLESNIAILRQREQELNQQGAHLGRCENGIQDILQSRWQYYRQTQQQYSWLSWNYADETVKRYFASSQTNGVKNN